MRIYINSIKRRMLFMGLQLISMSIGIQTIARADCLDEAAAHYHVNSGIVHAIATVESGMQPHRTDVNRDGSVDIGLMQVNSSWLPILARYGIRKRDLYDGCTSAYVGTWILARNIRQFGSTWDAVGAYNAATPVKRRAYARKVYGVARGVSDTRNVALPLFLPLHSASTRVKAGQHPGSSKETCDKHEALRKPGGGRKTITAHSELKETARMQKSRGKRPGGNTAPLVAYENHR
jgi:hypothetical protein